MQLTGEIKPWILSAAIGAALLGGWTCPVHASIAVSPKAVNFPNQAVGSTSTPITVTVTNYTSVKLKIVSAFATAAQFSFSGTPLPVILWPGHSLTGSVTFAPSGAQWYSGTLTFTPSKGPAISVALSGTGYQAPPPSTLSQPPIITTQPAGKTVTAGQTATFDVAATGTSSMSYQWKKNGALISGATSSSYTTPATTTSDNGALFTVVVSNSAGSATSNAATLSVNPAPVAPSITTQPTSQTVTAGQTATFTVTATGTAPLSYQWKKNGTAISGATSSSYSTPAETTSDNGVQFNVTVSNSAGSVTSNAVTLTVNALAGQLTASTSTLSFGTVNVGSSSVLGVTFTNSGASNITISNVSFSGAGFNVSGVSTGSILTPGQTALLNVTFAPAATGSVTGSVTVTSNASNSPAAIAVSGTGATPVSHSVVLTWTPSTSTVIGYNTYSSTVSGSSFVKLNSTPMATSSYTDTTVQSGKTYYYVVTAVDSSNNESSYSNQVSATIP